GEASGAGVRANAAGPTRAGSGRIRRAAGWLGRFPRRAAHPVWSEVHADARRQSLRSAGLLLAARLGLEEQPEWHVQHVESSGELRAGRRPGGRPDVGRYVAGADEAARWAAPAATRVVAAKARLTMAKAWIALAGPPGPASARYRVPKPA